MHLVWKDDWCIQSFRILGRNGKVRVEAHVATYRVAYDVYLTLRVSSGEFGYQFLQKTGADGHLSTEVFTVHDGRVSNSDFLHRGSHNLGVG